AGGIILTASHNPKEWNALKLLNHQGEFISAEAGKWILDHAEKGEQEFVKVQNLGKIIPDTGSKDHHFQAILSHPLVEVEAIKEKKFHIVLDAINSSGALFVPELLTALGVEKTTVINEEITGNFSH